MGQREAAEARTAAAARDFYGGRGSGVMKIRGSGSGRGSDVNIAAEEGSDNYCCQNVRAFQELSFEPNQ